MSSPHYVFAHKALPSLTFSDPQRMLATLTQEGGSAFLLDLWASVEQRCGSLLSPEGLSHTAGGAGDNGIIVCIRLPIPKMPAESYFVAIVAWLAPPTAPGQIDRVRIFTLEKAAPIIPGVVTYLGEWTKEGSHINLGSGPETTPEAFIAAIFDHLESDGPASPRR